MNYAAFTNDSLTMMYEAVRVRWRPTTPSSVRARKPGSAFARQPSGHAGELESEMLKRGMLFDVVDWSEDQTSLPFDE
jgi:hypothetical protein